MWVLYVIIIAGFSPSQPFNFVRPAKISESYTSIIVIHNFVFVQGQFDAFTVVRDSETVYCSTGASDSMPCSGLF